MLHSLKSIICLKEFSQGLIKPTAKATTPKQAVEKKAAAPVVTTQTAEKPVLVADGVGVKIPTSNLVMNEEFKCRVNELYNCFTDTNVSSIFK